MSDEIPVPPPAKGLQLSNTVIIGGLFAIAAALAVQEFMGGEARGPLKVLEAPGHSFSTASPFFHLVV